MSRRARDDAGFTLVEALVAVAVVAATSVALQRGLVSTRSALVRSDAVVAAEATARDILENRLPQLAAEVGERRGADGAVAWTVTSEALDLPFPPPPALKPAPASPPGRTPPPAAAAASPTPRAPEAAADVDPPPSARWLPLRVTIRVETAGAPLVVETVRLARAP
ncbi:prepilin-type N-terminal cleavage/methylation domain-containing protein [Methylopila henanensis]|uniref:Prepilin-type N-terminal cleavage/methylation domain-containing protein n=1 Tax=Methylopila henanensis TaxID=873516 RepID=A0ABW4K6H4_9HYPH